VARGIAANVGDERVSKNGYLYRKTEYGWELVHRIMAETKLGRKLHDNEYATFGDGDRTNLDPKNIVVRVRGRSSIRRRLAALDARIAEMTDARVALEKRLDIQESL